MQVLVSLFLLKVKLNAVKIPETKVFVCSGLELFRSGRAVSQLLVMYREYKRQQDPTVLTLYLYYEKRKNIQGNIA